MGQVSVGAVSVCDGSSRAVGAARLDLCAAPVVLVSQVGSSEARKLLEVPCPLFGMSVLSCLRPLFACYVPWAIRFFRTHSQSPLLISCPDVIDAVAHRMKRSCCQGATRNRSLLPLQVAAS